MSSIHKPGCLGICAAVIALMVAPFSVAQQPSPLAQGDPSPLIVLAQQAPNATSWALASLDQIVPNDIRQNLTFLREDLIDEGKLHPKTGLDAYRIGYQLCNTIIATLDERDKALVQAGMTIAQANAKTSVTSRTLDARRNYLMNWPQYAREESQRGELERQAVNNAAVIKEQPKVQWADRAGQLRASLDELYVKYRDSLRQDAGLVAVMARTGTVVGKSDPSPAGGVTITPRTIAPAKTVPSGPMTVGGVLTNTLGMKFVPVKGTDVLFCIHETRYRDYAVYAAEVSSVDGTWQNQTVQGFTITERAEDHPVMNVTWEEAQAFCSWLSNKDGKTYRLPSDREWSIAVGIGRDEKWTPDTLPMSLQQKAENLFPWKGGFPPKTSDKAGNYADTSHKEKAPRNDIGFVEGFDDGFPTTAPVMSLKANVLGIYDLGGNVWEWCEDWYDGTKTERVLRGASWGCGARTQLLSSYRIHRGPGTRHNQNGFRCVLVMP